MEPVMDYYLADDGEIMKALGYAFERIGMYIEGT